MGGGASWVTRAFALFDALINSRRLPQPDQPFASPASEGLTPEASAGQSVASIVRLDESQADPVVPHDESKIETAPGEQAKSPPDEMDDESRRKLIRQLFNEYWTGVEDKPPTFSERLEIAERDINDRLAGRDVGWRLDAATRKQLGLPPSSIAG